VVLTSKNQSKKKGLSITADNGMLKRRNRLFLIGKISFTLFFLIIIPLCVTYLWLTTPEVEWLQTTNPQETAMMRYRAGQAHHSGQLLRRKWEWVALSRISPHLTQAVIIAEDRLFFQHKGFDWDSIQGALRTNIMSRRIVRGASTITQQLAKNLFLNPSRNLIRKIREALITYQMEKKLSKERILELYLNVIEMGPEIYGLEAASQSYFQKPADELSISEAIRLASVINNPYRFSPVEDKNERMKNKQYYIVMFMLQTGVINFTTFKNIVADLSISDRTIWQFPLYRQKGSPRRLPRFRNLNRDSNYDR
jgi:monofunctional biosynthetic peptidoglycan transglycosylase